MSGEPLVDVSVEDEPVELRPCVRVVASYPEDPDHLPVSIEVTWEAGTVEPTVDDLCQVIDALGMVARGGLHPGQLTAEERVFPWQQPVTEVPR